LFVLASMKSFFTFFLGLLFIVLLASCNGSNNKKSVAKQEEALIQAYLDSMQLSISPDANGLYAYPITENPSGKSQASSGDVLSFFYKLSVLGGDVIDVHDSLDVDTTVVKQGASAVYPVGFDNALSYLKEGEKWGFIIPAVQAYGSFSYSSLIPENSTIIAEIELLKIRTEDEVLNEELTRIYNYVDSAQLADTVLHPLNKPENLPNGMIFKRVKAGSGTLPQPTQTVSITYTGRFLNKAVFDRAAAAQPFEFDIGDQTVIPGLESAVVKMQKGERALAIMPSYLAYRESAAVIPYFLTPDMAKLDIVPTYATKVGPYKPLIFEIELVDIK